MKSSCVEDFKNPVTSALIGTHNKLTALVMFEKGDVFKLMGQL